MANNMSTVIRFSGDSGDGMQMVGNLFSESAAFAGYGVFTFPTTLPRSAHHKVRWRVFRDFRSTSPRRQWLTKAISAISWLR